ncbi:NHL repeat-containing protein [Anaerocellum danielii]|uniref:Uncharacterized protein n=1 Tax=Anaerocellum danielii TaxID=1387557 RepID=A0ABZ0U5N9_9FIRM|nr:hypothetical protein [Caldicellulosiruptor danielii]WPX10053.1 hypothetical protein SOJ16_001312 [Caldicellulosiruptor danielii]
MKNFKKVITYLIVCSLVLISILSFLTVKSKALESREDEEKLWLSHFEEVITIPVSEKGIEYVSDMTGTGGPEAFDIKGNKVYIVDNAHHRILVYNKSSGEFIEEVKFPENIVWVSDISADGKGNLYLLGGNYHGDCLVTITNDKIRINSLPDRQQKGNCITISGFGSDENGPYVVYADLKEIRTLRFGNTTGKTSNLDADKPDSATVVEEKKGCLARDKAIWKLNIQGIKCISGQVITPDGDVVTVTFPLQYQLGTNSYIGSIGKTIFWKLEDGKSYTIAGYDKKTGEIDKVVKIPLSVYSVIPEKGFLVEDNDVYVLVPSQENVYVLKVTTWQSADEFMKELEKNDSISVNSSEKLNEQTKSQVSNNRDIVVATSVVTVPRSQIISTAQSYEWHQWYCSKVNYDGSNLSASNRQYWQRPRFITNYNTNYYQVPYCWGGFSSLSGFDNEIQQGYAAGNVNTNAPGYIGGTTGVDCSGFVSRCWGLSRHYHTSEFPSIAIKLNSYYELQQGDILLKNSSGSGHVRLFYTSNSSGQFVVYESTTSIVNGSYTDRVISMGYTLYELVNDGYQAYSPY